MKASFFSDLMHDVKETIKFMLPIRKKKESGVDYSYGGGSPGPRIPIPVPCPPKKAVHVIHLSVEEIERNQTDDEEKKIEAALLYSISKDDQTNEVRITPMNGRNYIPIHGGTEALYFIYHLLDYFQTE